MFVLRSDNYGIGDHHFDGYHTGKFYNYGGETYSIASLDLDEVKKYSSRKRAENAALAVNAKIVNYEYTVVSLEDALANKDGVY